MTKKPQQRPPAPAPAPAAPATETGAHAEPATPLDIAASFKQAVGEVEQEQNVQLKPTGARAAPRPAPAVAAPAPTWTAAGVGRAGVHLTNLLLGAGDFPLLEPEEEKGLAEDVAYYLSIRWPVGSKWEPELRLIGRVAEVAGPRFAARWKAQREEAQRLDQEAAELEAKRMVGKPGPGESTTRPTAGPPVVAKSQAALPTGQVVEVPSE